MLTKNDNLGCATICHESHHPQNQKTLRRYIWCQFGFGEGVGNGRGNDFGKDMASWKHGRRGA